MGHTVVLLYLFPRSGEVAFGSRGGGEKIELNGGMFYIPNRNRVRQLKKLQFSFINRVVSPLSFGKDIEINCHNETKKAKTKDCMLS